MDKSKKQFFGFLALVIFLIIVVLGILYLTDFVSLDIFIPYWVLILIPALIILIFVLEYLIKMKKKKR